jgi:hypothetical protein
MLLNINLLFLKNYHSKLIITNIKFIIISLFYLSKPFLIKSINSTLLVNVNYLMNILYKLILKLNNLYFIKLLLIYNNKFNLSKFSLPKKYSLTTVLKSPHTDKRSREQFHIIHYKSSLRYPLFYSIYNNIFLHSFFLFERGFNIVLKKKVLI